MQFDEYVRELNGAIGTLARVERFEADAKSAGWRTRDRAVNVALVPPMNVSVTLEGGQGRPTTTWYPVDRATVPIVSRRIAGFLSEA
jgi:hypothetical protein